MLQTLRDFELVPRTLISGMFPSGLAHIRAAEPTLRLGWSVPRVRRDYTTDMLTAIPALAMLTGYRAMLPRRARTALSEGRFDAIMAHWRVVTRALVRAVAEGGGELYVWTVDDERMIERLTAMGVDGIITNDPRLFSRSTQVAALKLAGSAPARLLCPAVVGRAADCSDGRAVSPLEVHHPAQRDRGLARHGLEREAACRPGAPRRAADRHEAGARAGEVDPLLARVQVLQAEAHVHPVVWLAVARHRAADADRVGLVGGVAHVDRRPQFVRVQQRPFARRSRLGRACADGGRGQRDRRQQRRAAAARPMKAAACATAMV